MIIRIRTGETPVPPVKAGEFELLMRYYGYLKLTGGITVRIVIMMVFHALLMFARYDERCSQELILVFSEDDRHA